MKRALMGILIIITLVVMAGCGGGGGGGVTSVSDVGITSPQTSITSKLSGTVTDSGNKPLSGVSVAVYDSTGNQIGNTTTGANGIYELTISANQQIDILFNHPSVVLNGPVSGSIKSGENKILNISSPADGPPVPSVF